MKTEINDTEFLIDESATGWRWIAGKEESANGFESACEATQDAIHHVRKQLLMALYLRRTAIWKSQPKITLSASPAAKKAYLEHEVKWLADMREIDGQIAAARKGLV